VRIVFLTHNYPRHPGDLAGAFLHPLARALAARGLDVRVVAPSDQGRGGEDVLDGIPVRRVRYASPGRERLAYTGQMQSALHSPGGWLAFGSMLRALRRAGREAASGSGDTVVHAHWWVPAGLAAPPELPLVLTVHGTDGVLLDRSSAVRAVARGVFRRARVVTAVSDPLARTVCAAARLDRGSCRVQPMPVDTTAWGWSEGGDGCLVVARLTRQKRVDLVLRALGHLRRSGRVVPCTVAGEGPERPALEDLARSEGVEGQVRFTGRLAPGEVHDLLMRADVAVSPFLQEGFGLVAAEALMAGVPVVACEDGGGLLDIVPREQGGRVVAPDSGRIAEAIVALFDGAADRAGARAAGQEWRERLDPERVAGRFARWYQEALGA